MTNREIIENMLQNLNENGLSHLANLFGDMDTKERYNKNTTQERLEELKQIEEQKENQRKINYENESMKKAGEEYDRIKTSKSALMGREKHFFEQIEGVKVSERYYMKYWELSLLYDIYNNNLINGCLAIFKYGLLKGQRAEQNRRRSKK
jgi:hypothetical protein